jgi:hypothetical protein
MVSDGDFKEQMRNDPSVKEIIKSAKDNLCASSTAQCEESIQSPPIQGETTEQFLNRIDKVKMYVLEKRTEEILNMETYK